MSYEVMVGNKACSLGVKLSRVQVVSAFPITPQTTITEYLSEMYASGEFDFEFINVEGELTSQVVVQSSERVGARSFTCTSGPGLLYMHHPMHRTANQRLPVVMAVVHRNTKGMQPDHSDLMSQQWTGWLHMYVENAQEILDSVVMSYKIAEDERVRLPLSFGYDGYILSYTAEPVEIPPQEEIDEFLPNYRPLPSILPDEIDVESLSRGRRGGDPQDPWREHHEAALNAKEVIKEVTQEWSKKFGRSYGNGLIEEYRTEDADAIITAMGTIAGSSMNAIDELRDSGEKIGLIKIRSFIPFPTEDFQRIARNVNAIGVIDRSICPGKGGPSFHKIRSAIYDVEERPRTLQFHAGLGGKEVKVQDLVRIGEKTLRAANGARIENLVEWV
jgi:pyruvate/2-oxoacid:ferredoxin oxidoreductase alpha subunit